MMPLSLLKEIKNDYSPISIHFPCLGEVTNKELKKKRLKAPTPVFLGFPSGSAGKESACNSGDLGLIPGLGRSPGAMITYIV